MANIKKIDIEVAVPGMFLEDVLDSRGVMLFAANTQITNSRQLDLLKTRGVRFVYINIEKGIDLPAKSVPVTNDEEIKVREQAYYQEIEKARVIHQAALNTVRQSLKSIRGNRSFETKDVEKAAEELVGSIMRNPDALISLSQIKGYDEYTYVHSVNVGILASSLARELGYSRDDILNVSMGGLLHDIGKMRVPESILNKPGKFADWEFKVMKKHPEHGIDILSEENRKISDMTRAMIVQHHERFNGTGYPNGLSGETIAEVGVIAAVSDVYDALTTDRVYRVAWTPQKALAHLFQGCGIDYSRGIVERFTKYLGIYPVGSFVKLACGELAVVTRVERGHLLAPVVTVLFDENERRLAQPREYNLLQKQQGADGQRYHVVLSLNPTPYRIRITDYILPQNMDDSAAKPGRPEMKSDA